MAILGLSLQHENPSVSSLTMYYPCVITCFQSVSLVALLKYFAWGETAMKTDCLSLAIRIFQHPGPQQPGAQLLILLSSHLLTQQPCFVGSMGTVSFSRKETGVQCITNLSSDMQFNTVIIFMMDLSGEGREGDAIYPLLSRKHRKMQVSNAG